MNILLICLKIIVDMAYCISVREMTPFLEHGMVDENRRALPQACDRLTFRATAGGSIAFFLWGGPNCLHIHKAVSSIEDLIMSVLQFRLFHSLVHSIVHSFYFPTGF